MKPERGVVGIVLATASALFAACERTPSAIEDTDGGAIAAKRSLEAALCAPDPGEFAPTSIHPFFPMHAGDVWVLEGEEDGEPIRVEITVLDETEVVAGVTTGVIEEREWEDGELVEVSRNFVAQATDGTVCYFGESVDDYEDGEIVGHEGAWRADEAGNRPGILMPADPRPGTKFVMEGAPGIAEDEGKIVGIGPVDVPAGRFTNTIRVEERNPLDGEKGDKVYARNVGLVIDETLELIEFSLD